MSVVVVGRVQGCVSTKEVTGHDCWNSADWPSLPVATTWMMFAEPGTAVPRPARSRRQHRQGDPQFPFQRSLSHNALLV